MENNIEKKSQARKYNSGQGKREDLDNKYFRSKWEANYARFLNLIKADKQIKDWEYETMEFEFPVKRGNRFYKIDFKVINNDDTFEIHEVKGFYDKSSLTKLKRMAKYHPKIKIKMIDKNWFKANGKTIKSLIPNWE